MEQMERRTALVSLLYLYISLWPTFRDSQRRAPLITQNVQAYATVGVDVGVVDTSGEGDFGRLEGVVGREVDVEEEDAAGVGRVTLEKVSACGRDSISWAPVG
jgi:hypothetical protein